MSGSDAREDLLAKLFELFARRGFEGVSIGDISLATGLGRSSLYHHFPGGKDEMALGVVAFARRALSAGALEALRREGPVGARIDAMLAAVSEIYACGARPCVLAALLSSAPEGPLSRAVADVFAEWVNALADAVAGVGVSAAEARARARAALALIQGGLVMSRALGDPAAFQEAVERARSTLIAQGESK